MDKCEGVWVGGEGVCAADVCLSPAGIKEGGSRFIGEDKVQFKNIPQSYAVIFIIFMVLNTLVLTLLPPAQQYLTHSCLSLARLLGKALLAWSG